MVFPQIAPLVYVGVLLSGPTPVDQGQGPATPPAATQPVSGSATEATVPGDYVIGADDVLGILFWRDTTMSGDFVVRPDGRISLPLINDVVAAGLTPEALRQRLLELAKRYVDEPSVTVIVRTINSRKVFVTGQVAHPAAYPLTSPTTVLQILALAGGLNDYADGKNIRIIRKEPDREISLKFNYEDVRKGKNLQQNILLKAGDVVIVP
jgi:polysaccharide export outer membrane protein